MELFIKPSNPSKLQQRLDLETDPAPTVCAIEESPVEPSEEKHAVIFGKPKKKTIFQVDLMGDWVKP
jgi:hypothetical protein